MAKVPFSKLQANLKADVIECSYNNKNNEPVIFEVKTYLPFKEKLELASSVINQSVDNNGFYNPMRVKLFMTLEIIYAYTNLTFTDKMKEDIFKLYDLVISTNIYEQVINAMGEKEYQSIKESIYDTIKNIYDYKNSVLGILETVTQDYDNLNLDITKVQDAINNPESISLLREVLDKLG